MPTGYWLWNASANSKQRLTWRGHYPSRVGIAYGAIVAAFHCSRVLDTRPFVRNLGCAAQSAFPDYGLRVQS